ncbi:putative membrane protein [Candidatus Burkholderia pumila]|uniref:Membrane protein n=1 Tax=Candidatus Burkholderia pumila TaxID=1090375 RepID=A0ABR5HKY1_9BURK|nr:putative membrane protein [Candidatus Burkholderia pumila]
MNEYEYLITDTPFDPVRGEYNAYSYGEFSPLPPHTFMLCCLTEAALQKMRLKNLETDAYAILTILVGWPFRGTRGKFAGATKETSLASIVCRALFDIDFKQKILPTLTLTSVNTLRFRMVNNLGVFIGPTIPLVGWAVLVSRVIN